MPGEEDAGRAVAGECFGDCEADAARATGDERGFAGKGCERHPWMSDGGGRARGIGGAKFRRALGVTCLGPGVGSLRYFSAKKD